jgi:transposase InsO family protein
MLVLDALEMGISQRQRQGHSLQGLVHHSDSQYTSIRYTERLAEAGAQPSVGSVGNSYDNAMAESIIGLFRSSGRATAGSERVVRILAPRTTPRARLGEAGTDRCFEESPVVVPVDPFQRREFDGIRAPPGALMADQCPDSAGACGQLRGVFGHAPNGASSL